MFDLLYSVFFRIQLIVSLFMINSRQLNSSRTSMAYLFLFSDSSDRKTDFVLLYQKCYINQWFPFPASPKFLSEWYFPYLQGITLCHEVSFSSSSEKDLHPLPPKPHVHLSMYTAFRLSFAVLSYTCTQTFYTCCISLHWQISLF